MTSMNAKGSRIRDVVRDSKILRDIPSKLHRNCDSFTSEVNQGTDGVRYHLKQNTHRVERDMPRRPPVWVCEGHDERKYNIREENMQWVRSKIPMLTVFASKDNLLKWIDIVDCFFEKTQPPENLKCKLASYALEGEVEQWWQQLQHRRFMGGESMITLWPRMKFLLINDFWPAICSRKCPLQVCNDRLGEKCPYDHPNDLSFTMEITAPAIRNYEEQKSVGSVLPAKCSIEAPNESCIRKQEAANDLRTLGASMNVQKNSGVGILEKTTSQKLAIDETIEPFQQEGLIEALGEDTQKVQLSEVLEDKKDSCDEQETPDFEVVKMKWGCKAVHEGNKQLSISATVPPYLSQRWSRCNIYEIEVKSQTWDIEKGGAESIVQKPKAGWFEAGISLQGPVLLNYRDQQHQVERPKFVNAFNSITNPFAVGYIYLTYLMLSECKGSDYNKFVLLFYDPGGTICPGRSEGIRMNIGRSVGLILSRFSHAVKRAYNWSSDIMLRGAALIEKYAKCGQIRKDYPIFKSMPMVLNSVIPRNFISSYGGMQIEWSGIPSEENKSHDAVVHHLALMESKLHHGLSRLVYGLIKAGKMGNAKFLLYVMMMKKLEIVGEAYILLTNALYVDRDEVFGVLTTESLPKNRGLEFFIGVLSAAYILKHKMAIRRKWLQYKSMWSGSVALWVFVGLHVHQVVNKELWNETRIYSHIQLMPFVGYSSLAVWTTLGICNFVTDAICEQSDAPDPIINVCNGSHLCESKAYKQKIRSKAWIGWFVEDKAFVVGGLVMVRRFIVCDQKDFGVDDELKREMGGSDSKGVACGRSTQKYVLTEMEEVTYLSYRVHMTPLLGLAPVWKFYAYKLIGQKEVWIQPCLYCINVAIQSSFMRCLPQTHSEAVLISLPHAKSFIFTFIGYPGYTHHITRGQVFLGAGRNDDLYEERRYEETLKLFHTMLNGLDPPMTLDGACEAYVLIFKTFNVADSITYHSRDDAQT